MVEQAVFDNRFTERLVVEAVRRLFDADGTVYLATGYLTWSGYLAIRDKILEFLARSPDNRVVIVVSTGADQFSRLVATALWNLDFDDRIRLLTYRDGFVHPKLYLRDGPDPALVMGSANLTWDGLGKNLELAWYYEPDDPADPVFQSHLEWMLRFVTACDRVTPADLKRYVRLRKTIDTWTSKGRINLSTMLRRAVPFGRRSSSFEAPLSFDDEQ
ncbi:PLD-like domain-containing protein [Natronoarchaeum philippinense]|uniref:PLD-like domain-containing protein n=1 Tax=Natronoarchaeum philippinense TaxID=558529 RepID=A0A285NS27_NATPI|nr:phospholipase D family protein [Natronoarchaeum philippinense]SNZ11988.1 PLD-like domain-containing protein [Natronoarchaeum philippinense]